MLLTSFNLFSVSKGFNKTLKNSVLLLNKPNLKSEPLPDFLPSTNFHTPSIFFHEWLGNPPILAAEVKVCSKCYIGVKNS